MQPAALDAGTGGDAGLRKTVGDILQDRRVLGEHRPVVGAQGRHQPERVDLRKSEPSFCTTLVFGSTSR